MNKLQNTEIEKYILTLTDFQKGIVGEIRSVVLCSDENIKEAIKWGSIAFFNKKNICAFRIARAHVTLLFMEGALLNDHYNILEGAGSKARTIKVKRLEDIESLRIQDLVQQAIKLGM